jgi:soluble lytic murein transglycosylase-like protein
MKRLLTLAWFAAVATLVFPALAQAQQHGDYDELVATHARANGVPEALVHRVIVRESRYRPGLVGRGGTIGLMQIKLATARSLGYTGTAEGLRDPDTNLAYGVKYLAGAYRAANSDHSRAMHYFASGYYQAAKRERTQRRRHPEPLLASAPPKETAKETAKGPANPAAEARAQQVPAPQAGVNAANAR